MLNPVVDLTFFIRYSKVLRWTLFFAAVFYILQSMSYYLRIS